MDELNILRNGDLESLRLASRLLTGAAMVFQQYGLEEISVDSLSLFLLEMSGTIENYIEFIAPESNMAELEN